MRSIYGRNIGHTNANHTIGHAAPRSISSGDINTNLVEVSDTTIDTTLDLKNLVFFSI